MEIKFYRSESGARAFAQKHNGKFAKKPSAAYYNMCHDAETLGIEVTGDYAVRYLPHGLNMGVGTIFDPLPSSKFEKGEENQTKRRGGKRAGAGRKGIQDGVERKKRGIYCSELEFEMCKKIISMMRSGKDLGSQFEK